MSISILHLCLSTSTFLIILIMLLSDSLSLSLSLSIPLYHPLLLVAHPDCIPCLHKAVVGKFLLVGQHWHVHVMGSIGERYFRFRPYFSSSIPHILLVLELLFRGVLFQDSFNIASRILVKFLSSFFSINFVSVHVGHLYSSINKTTA